MSNEDHFFGTSAYTPQLFSPPQQQDLFSLRNETLQVISQCPSSSDHVVRTFSFHIDSPRRRAPALPENFVRTSSALHNRDPPSTGGDEHSQPVIKSTDAVESPIRDTSGSNDFMNYPSPGTLRSVSTFDDRQLGNDSTVNLIDMHTQERSLFKAAIDRDQGFMKRPCLHRIKLKSPRSNESPSIIPTMISSPTVSQKLPLHELRRENRTQLVLVPSEDYSTNYYNYNFGQDSNSPHDQKDDYLDRERERLLSIYMSVISNFLFLTGGFFSALISGYIIRDAQRDLKHRNEWNDAEFEPWSPSKYYVISMMSPLFFLLNAFMDLFRFAYAKHVSKQGTEFNLDGDPRWDFVTPSFFGMAALIDLISSFINGDDVGWQNDASILSAHVYLISAVTALVGLRFDAASPGDLLFAIGTMLFLIGSLIDACLSYVASYGVEPEQEVSMYTWSLASAILWTVDATLYLMADFFFSPAPERLMNTAKDMGISCENGCGGDFHTSYTSYNIH